MSGAGPTFGGWLAGTTLANDLLRIKKIFEKYAKARMCCFIHALGNGGGIERRVAFAEISTSVERSLTFMMLWLCVGGRRRLGLASALSGQSPATYLGPNTRQD